MKRTLLLRRNPGSVDTTTDSSDFGCENFHIETRDSGVKVLHLHAGPMNILKLAFMEELNGAFNRLIEDPYYKGLVIASDIPDMFIAGADINEIALLHKIETPAITGYEVPQRGKEILRKLRTLSEKAPVVAAINGPAKGGGFELAQWAMFRLISDNPKSLVALSETKLGVGPGFGGCILTPQLMGDSVAAVQFIAKGDEMPAQDAWKAGLVDEIVPADQLIERAEQVVLTGRVHRYQAPLNVRLTKAVKTLTNGTELGSFLLGNCLGRFGRRILTKSVVAQVKSKGKQYVSPSEAAKVVMASADMDFEKALRLESRMFAAMAQTNISRNLVQLFLNKSRAKKVAAGRLPGDIKIIGIVGGAGVMGKEIGFLAALSDATTEVFLVDIKQEFLDEALADISRLFDYQVKDGKLTAQDKADKMSKIRLSTGYGALCNCDVIIEAVRETIADKHAAYAQIDASMEMATSGKPYWILSNTSSLKLAQLAKGTRYPHRFCGFHAFNPASLMPLIECIAAAQTDDVTAATAVALASAFGKVPVLCRDETAFVVNAILGPMLIVVAWLLSIGVAPRDIDKAMLDLGFAKGPVTLLDFVGLDVVAEVAKSLQAEFGQRMALPPDKVNVMAILLKLGQKGNKTGGGIYLWKDGKPVFDKKAKCNVLNPALVKAFPDLGKTKMAPQAIQELLLGAMKMEALRVLERGVVSAPYLIDLAMVFGAGYPPSRGGPITDVDQEGVIAFHDACNDIAMAGPETWRQNFKPCALLIEHSQSRLNIYQESETAQ